MTEAAREARKAYKRRWNKEHPDKVREYQERHWEKLAAMEAAKAKEESAEAESQGGEVKETEA